MSIVPPPPISKPGRVLVYNVLKAYQPKKESELEVNEGDLVFVSEYAENSDLFCDAKCDGSTGRLPRSFLSDDGNVGQISYPLHESAKRGNIGLLRECLENKVSVNSLDKSGSTALYWAAHGGHDQLVRHLLSTPNVSISSQNKLGDTPLHAAAWKGRLQCVELLIEAGADVHLKNNDKKKPMDMAATAEIAALISITMSSRYIGDQNYETDSSVDEEQND